jgi:nicotinate-nucleotide adenylyltransferase
VNAIGVYGGSFDPVHHGHLTLVRAALRHIDLAPLYVVPAYQPPHKEQTGASFAHRLAMARLAFADIPGVALTDLERERGGISYTIDSVEYLKARHPGSEVYLLIGADTAEEIGTWKSPDRLAKLVRLLVAPRSDHHEDTRGAWRMSVVPMEPIDISATDIRRRVRAGEPLTGLMPAAVAEYIERHQLYRP